MATIDTMCLTTYLGYLISQGETPDFENYGGFCEGTNVPIEQMLERVPLLYGALDSHRMYCTVYYTRTPVPLYYTLGQ